MSTDGKILVLFSAPVDKTAPFRGLLEDFNYILCVLL